MSHYRDGAVHHGGLCNCTHPDCEEAMAEVMLQEAVWTVAAHVARQAAIIGTSAEWENYPDLGSLDWNLVREEMLKIFAEFAPSATEFQEACNLLAERAKGTEA